MLSIITAVHNQLEMNKVFWKHLAACTRNEYELIIIDNNSSDGSGNFFKDVGARVITNDQNFSYPVSQNQGIRIATGDHLVFINNDVIVSQNWDKRLLANMLFNDLDVITCCGIEQVENARATRMLKRRWRYFRVLARLLGKSQITLELMHSLMYKGDWDGFCDRRFQEFKLMAFEGFVGNTVVMTRRAIEILGLWDETQQGADFDLYLRSKMRHVSVGDIKPVHIALDVFNHHFIRLTLGSRPDPFFDRDRLIPLESKWTSVELEMLNDRHRA
jgi:glycosyltransferase involved in cell wall biosynthesis